MSNGITNPRERYFRNGTWVWVEGEWLEVPGDADGAMSVSVHSQDVNVTIEQSDPANLQTGLHGWDGAAWQRLPLLWGFSDIYLETKSNENVSAGKNSIYFSTVPAGEVWVIKSVSARCSTDNPYSVEFLIGINTTYHLIASIEYTKAWITVGVISELVLKEGHFMRVCFVNNVEGDNDYAAVTGYKMKIA